jgi:hypothetical protein
MLKPTVLTTKHSSHAETNFFTMTHFSHAKNKFFARCDRVGPGPATTNLLARDSRGPRSLLKDGVTTTWTTAAATAATASPIGTRAPPTWSWDMMGRG